MYAKSLIKNSPKSERKIESSLLQLYLQLQFLLFELLFEVDEEEDEDVTEEELFKLSFPLFSFPDCENNVKLIVKNKRMICNFLSI